MSNLINNRSEILFLYDTTYANPNGDPTDMNRPRIDEDSLKCLVTDVRLKRTVRDYIDERCKKGKGNDIFIKEIRADDNTIFSVKKRMEVIEKMVAEIKKEKSEEKSSKKKSVAKKDITEYILKHFIDTRLFGATYPMDKDSVKLTGPVQFNIGRSLNKVREVPFTLSPIMASGENKKSGTLADAGKKTIKYGVISFDGLVSENAAKHTNLTDEDVSLLFEALWFGTKELRTTSKNQKPLLLVNIEYKSGFFVGDLSSYLKFINNEDMEFSQVENVNDYSIDTSNLNKVLKKHKDKITSIQVKKDDRLSLSEPIWNAEELTIEQ